MAHKECIKDLKEKIFETLLGNSVGKDYDCLFDLGFDFKETLYSLNFRFY